MNPQIIVFLAIAALVGYPTLKKNGDEINVQSSIVKEQPKSTTSTFFKKLFKKKLKKKVDLKKENQVHFHKEKVNKLSTKEKDELQLLKPVEQQNFDKKLIVNAKDNCILHDTKNNKKIDEKQLPAFKKIELNEGTYKVTVTGFASYGENRFAENIFIEYENNGKRNVKLLKIPSFNNIVLSKKSLVKSFFSETDTNKDNYGNVTLVFKKIN